MEREPSDAGLHMLANMLHAVKDCVSSLKERKHDTLINEMFAIRLWSCPSVRWGPMQWSWVFSERSGRRVAVQCTGGDFTSCSSSEVSRYGAAQHNMSKHK